MFMGGREPPPASKLRGSPLLLSRVMRPPGVLDPLLVRAAAACEGGGGSGGDGGLIWGAGDGFRIPSMLLPALQLQNPRRNIHFEGLGAGLACVTALPVHSSTAIN